MYCPKIDGNGNYCAGDIGGDAQSHIVNLFDPMEAEEQTALLAIIENREFSDYDIRCFITGALHNLRYGRAINASNRS